MKLSSQPFVLAAAAALAFYSNVHAEGTPSGASQDSMGQQSGQQGQLKQAELPKESIEFEKGMAMLNKDAKNKLSQLVQASQKQGQIDHLTVVAWADTAYPPKDMQSQQSIQQQQGQQGQQQAGSDTMPQQGQQQPTQVLSQAELDLAQKRADVISSYLRDQLNVTNVKTIVMGKDHADWFASAFRAEEAELQSQFARAGETPVTHPEFQVIKEQAKESVGLVIVTPVSMAQQSGSGMGTGTTTTPGATGTGSGTDSSGY